MSRKIKDVYLKNEPYWNNLSLLDRQIEFLEGSLTKSTKEAIPTYYKKASKEIKELKKRRFELKG